VAQLEGQKQGIIRFACTGVHDILERNSINIENWCKVRMSIWYWLCAIGNVYKTCHDGAAPNEAGGEIKERRRPGKVNTVAHEVHGPSNQVNVAADGSEGRRRWYGRLIQSKSQNSATSSGFSTGVGCPNGTPGSGIHAKQSDRSGCRILH
jgi:hypothetical protein